MTGYTGYTGVMQLATLAIRTSQAGSVIKETLTAQGRNQTWLARRLRVKRGSLTYWLNEHGPMPLDVALEAAGQLGIPKSVTDQWQAESAA